MNPMEAKHEIEESNPTRVVQGQSALGLRVTTMSPRTRANE